MLQVLGPFDPRPGNAPVYVAKTCSTCGRPLVLDDALDELPPHLHFHDEWVCPVHRDLVVLDRPQ